MQKPVELLLNPHDPMILKCTGQIYDGIDDNYCSFMSAATLNFNKPITVDYARAKQTISINPGDPLYHICWLSYFVRKMLDNQQINRMQVDVALFYTVKWLHAQSDKLLNKPKSDKDLSEFQLSQKVFDKEPRKDDCLFTFAIENLISNLMGLTVLMPDNRYLNVYGSSMLILAKCLDGALTHDSILSKKKHIDSFKACINVMKMDTLFAKLFFLVANKQYANAEAYANKCLKNINKIYPGHRPPISIRIAIAQSFIAAKAGDIDLCLIHIDRVLQLDKDNHLRNYVVNDHYFIDSCEFAAEYFQKNSGIDTAIKYYELACRYSKDKSVSIKYVQKLKSLESSLLLQISKETTEKYSNLLSDVSVVVDKLQLILYFKNDDQQEKFKKIMTKNKITYSGHDQKNALVLTIGYQFPVDVFYKALSIAKKLSKKTVESKLPEQTVTVEEKIAVSRVVEGESGRHPHAAVTKKKPSRPKPENIPEIVVQPWEFLKSRKVKPLEVIAFPNAKKIFDPAQTNGVATLRVDGFSGRWFACMSPKVIIELDKLYPGEGAKLNKLFLSSIELANNLCVPCYKEMKIKSKDLGIDLPYVFKIRLLGKGGVANVRIYAKIIDQTADGKKLVVFSAINPNSHNKHTKPIDYEHTDIAHEEQSKEDVKLC